MLVEFVWFNVLLAPLLLGSGHRWKVSTGVSQERSLGN